MARAKPKAKAKPKAVPKSKPKAKMKTAPKAKTKARAKARSAPRRGGMPPIAPHLVCSSAEEAIAFYKDAFGATEMMRLKAKNGKIIHASLMINGAPVMLVDEFPNMGNAAPTTLNGTPVTIHLTVPDVDSFTERAIEAGAKVIMPVADMFWGDRYGIIEDPSGHRWSIATHIRAMTPEEIRAAMDCMPGM
jgi:uncharacterized glyoxalase superfamily protein PhnB